MKNNRWTVKKIDTNKIIEMFNSGIYISDIALKESITIDRIRRTLKMSGIAVPSKSDFWKTYGLPYENDVVNDYLQNKKTILQLCNKFKVGREKINYILDKNKVERRRYSEAIMLDYQLGRRIPRRCNGSGTKNIFGQLFHQWQYGAKVRNIPFNISKEQIQELFEIQNGRCAYSGVRLISPITLKERLKYQGHPKLISLDRINSELPYTISNVQLVCNWINKGKGNMSHYLFLEVINELKQSLCNV